MGEIENLLNGGVITNCASAASGRTFIVTGLQRSGTSLVAAILRQAGIFLGSQLSDAVYEDEEIAGILDAGDLPALQRIIVDRNANHARWGFKYPMLCDVIEPRQVTLFDRPRIIATFRDPIAMALRTSLSEYQEPMSTLRDVVRSQAQLLSFVGHIDCPNLLLSYEKALMFPGKFVDTLMEFCGIPPTRPLHTRLLALIEPNQPHYIASARRRYEGLIEGVRDGKLYGWCQLTKSTTPVALEIIVDDNMVLNVVADTFRQDLMDAGVGKGRHGFFIALDALRARPDSVIRVRVAQRDVELGNSGTRLCEFGTAAA